MKIENDTKLDFSDVLIKPKRSTLKSRGDVDLYRHFDFKTGSYGFDGIPLIAANMTSVGTLKAALALQESGIMTCLHKYVDSNDILNLAESGALNFGLLAYTVGISDSYELKRFGKLQLNLSASMTKFRYLCIDVANGYTERFVDFVAKVRTTYPNLVIIAGNVCTPEMTEQLILSGADIVKVGIGSGSMCLTRIKTGVGYPQLSAIIECADAAHGLGGSIISDGGCTTPGDIVKAFGAGADFVMLGSMLAAHDENSDNKFAEYAIAYGMSSTKASQLYGKEETIAGTSEGRVVEIKQRGPINNTVNDILGGLRSACTYIGAQKIKHLPKCTTFIKVSQTHSNYFENQTIGE